MEQLHRKFLLAAFKLFDLLIMIAVFAIMLAMPKIMALVSWAGPYGGVAVAIAFMLAFFGVFWLRSRAQKKPDANE